MDNCQTEHAAHTNKETQSAVEFLFTTKAMAGLALWLASGVMLFMSPVAKLAPDGNPFWMPHIVAAFALILGIALSVRNRSVMQLFVAGALAAVMPLIGPELAAMGAEMAQAKQ